MKNYLKKFAAGTAAVMMLSSFAVFAEDPAVTIENDSAPIETAAVAAPIEPIVVHAEEINGVTMIPIRSTAEHFGYTVDWDGESSTVFIFKDAKSVTFSIGSDSYAFSKMAPGPLGAAPILFNDSVTYVPLALFTDLLDMNCRETEEGIVIAEPRIVELTEITEGGSLVVKDDFFGEVIVHIGEDTILTANGESASKDMLKEGQLLSVEYSSFMTMSLPPQTPGVEIEILNLPVDAE